MPTQSYNFELLEPSNCALLLLDYQAQMLFGVKSRDRDVVINNVVALTRAAETFNLPIVVSTLASSSINGPLFMDLQAVLPSDVPTIDRTVLNAWRDEKVLAAVKKTKRNKLLIAGLWSHVGQTYTTLSAIGDGYHAYPVTDTGGAPTNEAHEIAVQRMMLAGAIPVTWQQVMFELQRDWTNATTAEQVHDITRKHFGAFSQGIVYPQMLGGKERRMAAGESATRRPH